jgi:hypothetical protein
MRRFEIIVIWVLAIYCAVALNGQALSHTLPINEQQRYENALDTWVQTNYTSILDSAFRNSCDVPKVYGEMKWTVCARIVPGEPGDPEFVLLVGKGYDDKSFARISRAKGKAVYTQIGNYKREHPTATSSNMVQFIDLETREFDNKDYPALAHVEAEFERVRFSPALPSTLYSDATEYSISIDSCWGNKMVVVLNGPSSYSAHQPHPLLSWIETTRKMLAESFK